MHAQKINIEREIGFRDLLNLLITFCKCPFLRVAKAPLK